MITDLLPPATLAVIALLVIPAVVGLVNMLKAVGLATRWAGPVAVALGLVVMLAYGLVTDPPASPAQLFIYGLAGVLIGLGAVGLYDLVKLSGTSPQRPDSSERSVNLE